MIVCWPKHWFNVVESISSFGRIKKRIFVVPKTRKYSGTIFSTDFWRDIRLDEMWRLDLHVLKTWSLTSKTASKASDAYPFRQWSGDNVNPVQKWVFPPLYKAMSPHICRCSCSSIAHLWRSASCIFPSYCGVMRSCLRTTLWQELVDRSVFLISRETCLPSSLLLEEFSSF